MSKLILMNKTILKVNITKRYENLQADEISHVKKAFTGVHRGMLFKTCIKWFPRQQHDLFLQRYK